MSTNTSSTTRPLRANWPTRVLYVLAIFSCLPYALMMGTNVRFLARHMGVHGVITWVGLGTFAALILFRAYQVLRYPAALDARRPSTLGRLLRRSGLLGMVIGTAAATAFFLIGPVTRILVESVSESGVEYFVIGLTLLSLSSFGWLGCLVFEVSRTCGPSLSPVELSPRFRGKQDLAVMALLIGSVVGSPYWSNEKKEVHCGEDNLTACMSTTHAEIHRVIALSVGDPVVLESNVDEIEFRRSSAPSSFETPLSSLAGAGYPAGDSTASPVRVQLMAQGDGAAVVLQLVFLHNGEETARFVTRFPEGAAMEPTAPGRWRVVLHVPPGVRSGSRVVGHDPKSGRRTIYDQLFVQIRSALGSDVEAREWSRRQERPATLVGTTTRERPFAYVASNVLEPACAGIVKRTPAKERSFRGELAWSMQMVSFTADEEARAHTLIGPMDRVHCRQDSIWIVSYADRRPEIRIRRYDTKGELLMFVDTRLPPADLRELQVDQIDPATLSDRGGDLRFERVVWSTTSNKEKRRELFSVSI